MALFKPRAVIENMSFNDIMSELDSISNNLLPNWNFEDRNDVGRFILELQTIVHQRTSIFANRAAIEARSLEEAVDPVSVRLHAQNLDYRPITAQTVYCLHQDNPISFACGVYFGRCL